MRKEKRSIKELNLIEDFMFTEASMDETTAQLLMRLIIERATKLKIGRLLIECQKTVNGVDTDCHGIRLDVSIKEITEEDGKTIQLFDVEPNNDKKSHLPKRSRFYQALLDVKILETGVDYEKLPDLWTIWILPYDPFGLNYMIYSVKNIVEESRDIEYNDGVRKLFLYTGGENGGTNELKNLLTYMQNSSIENAVDEDLRKLHLNVERLKGRKEIGVKYMQMQDIIKYKVRDEVEETVAEIVDGIVEETTRKVTEEVTQKVTEEVTKEVTKEVTNAVEQNMVKLTKALLEEGRYEDLRRVTEDEAYRKEMLKKYSTMTAV